MSDNNDAELIRQFEDCSLPLEWFRHSVHIQIAFLYLCRYPALDVLGRFPEALKRYATAHGKDGLYHETITWAYILLIQERMTRAGRTQGWAEFKLMNPDLLNWSESILKHYYSSETLWSEMARRVFLFPDRAPAFTCQDKPAVQPQDQSFSG